MTMPSVADLIADSAGRYWKFETINERKSGTITEVRVEPETNFGTEIPKVDKEGNIVHQIILTVKDDADGRERAVFVRAGTLRSLAGALLTVGAKEPLPGGRIMMTYSHVVKSANGKDVKQYVFQYAPPAAGYVAPEPVVTDPGFSSEEPPF